MRLRCATFNVLADAYLGYGDYSRAKPELLVPGARLPLLLRLIADLRADVIGLQEVEAPLAAALKEMYTWRLLRAPKQGDRPDGCLLLLRHGLNVSEVAAYGYSDGSGGIAQRAVIEGVTFVNTHIKWAPKDDPHHVGVRQTRELLEWVGPSCPAVVFADCNDRPGGPVRALVDAAGFVNLGGDEPTALIGHEKAALDLLAVRHVRAKRIVTQFQPVGIPSADCPSDHIPVMAEVETA